MSAKKIRLDKLLREKNFFSSRSKAKRAIMAGEVRVDGEVVDKAGERVSEEAEISVEKKKRFVSRGGHKLQAALENFSIDPSDREVLDVGSSTGGFTDCLLQKGARKVVAVDSGTNQLAWKLRSDERVEVREQTNFRYLTREELPCRFDLVVVDVSFISLTLIIPNTVNFMFTGSDLIALIKPQFEAGPDNVQDGGVVRDPDIHRRVLERVISCAVRNDFNFLDICPSPLRGEVSKNLEYLTHYKYMPDETRSGETEPEYNSEDVVQEKIDSAVMKAHKMKQN